jgi:hypothetical protein
MGYRDPLGVKKFSLSLGSRINARFSDIAHDEPNYSTNFDFTEEKARFRL